MSTDSIRRNALNSPSYREKYGRSLLASIAIHGVVFALLIWGWYLFPSTAIRVGTGPGGGAGGDISTVGVVDEFSGGAGMTKPSIVPKPPALEEEKPAVDQSKAIPLPKTIESKKKPNKNEIKKAAKESPQSNVVPTKPEPGSGGIGGRSGGSGGGVGGGVGVSVGAGSGGFGDSWYARTVEQRISSNWSHPPEGVRVDIVYSFYIASNGTIYGIKQEKSSGNSILDMTAEGAIRASNPLTPPPPEFRGRSIQFIAEFVYPPNP
jgi:outer membrane biosynthesis protein TonB